MPTDRQMRLFKRAFMPLTDQASAAQGAPMPPPGGMPMDPAMMGGAPAGAMPPPGAMPPVDPATGMPMDPAMMGGAPMPPVDPATGMPMDPAMMGGTPAGAPPMDPAMMGGAPAGAPVQTGDLAIDMLLQMGAMIVDPNGQPVPPEIISQIVAEINNQTGGGAQPGQENEVMTTLSQMDKTMALLLDKVDALRDIVDSVMPERSGDKKSAEEGADEMDAELADFLAAQAAQGAQPMPAEAPVPEEAPMVEPMPPEAAVPMGGVSPEQMQQLGLIQAMQQGN